MDSRRASFRAWLFKDGLRSGCGQQGTKSEGALLLPSTRCYSHDTKATSTVVWCEAEHIVTGGCCSSKDARLRRRGGCALQRLPERGLMLPLPPASPSTRAVRAAHHHTYTCTRQPRALRTRQPLHAQTAMDPSHHPDRGHVMIMCWCPLGCSLVHARHDRHTD